jgi:hypothetical protein
MVNGEWKIEVIVKLLYCHIVILLYCQERK